MMRKLFYVFMAVLVISFLATACSHYTGRSAREHVDDAKIKAQIDAAIVKDPSLSVMRTTVAVFGGNVTLSGQVPSKEAEQRLIDIARNTEGVRSVRTNLTVAPAAIKPTATKSSG